MDRKELVTAERVAEVLGVSAQSVKNWAKSGRIPSVRITERTIRFDLDEVLAALTNRGDPEPPAGTTAVPA